MSRWEKTLPLAQLARTGKAVTRVGSKQIALFLLGDTVAACNNRCPHEGYPLAEGSVDEQCRLTCNWHNWKFDLESGDNLFGGDALRVYPTRVQDGVVLVDVAEPPREARVEAAFDRLGEASDDDDYPRMARELARLSALDVPYRQAVAWAIGRAAGRLEYGFSHAFAAAEDWLSLMDELTTEEQRLTAALEPVAHIARDSLRQPRFEFPEGRDTFDEQALVDAVEAEDEARVIALLRGALHDEVPLVLLERALARAALVHYADFGHSLIYVQKAFRGCARLGPAVHAPLLFALGRSLVYAQREDLVPEFRGYRAALERFGVGTTLPRAEELSARGVPGALDAIVAGSGLEPERLFSVLLEALASNLLHFDVAWMTRSDRPYSDNVDWLDVTHGITFAHAVWTECTKFERLWPAGLLQLACFVGRNTRYLDPRADVSAFRVTDAEAFFCAARAKLLDHGQVEPIVSAHLLKTLSAAEELFRAGHRPPALLPGVNRFFHTPLPRRHVRRTACQALAFVAKEG